MTATARIFQISVSPGGVPKRPVASARVTRLGLEGDAHRNHAHHGGPERAVCLFALERIRTLQMEGHPIVAGAIGENLTVEGLDWSSVGPGTRLGLGDTVVVAVTRYTSPCRTIAASFLGHDYHRVSEDLHPGDSRVYARVLVEGAIRRGDPVRIVAAD